MKLSLGRVRSGFSLPTSRAAVASLAVSVGLAATYAMPAHAVTGPFMWKGYTWTPTTGGMAGICNGDPANVTVDASGYLHLKITNSGGTWTASEVFTTTSLGFGTYQWQIAGPLDRMDHSVVLGLYPYGPEVGIGKDGTNEIDTEFSFWNDEAPGVNADWGVYPPSASAMHWEDDFLFSLQGGSATTTRMVWSKSGITGTLMSGFQALGATAGVLATTSYMPPNPTSEIPQQALPLGMNLWCYEADPSSGKDAEIVIQDFQFVPEGQAIPDAGAGTGPDAGQGEGDAAAGADAGAPSDAAPPEASEGDEAATSADAQSGPPASGGDAGGSLADASEGDSSAGGSSSGAFGDGGPASSGGCGCVSAGREDAGMASLLVVGAILVLGPRRRASRARS